MTDTSEIEHFSVPISVTDFLDEYMADAPPLERVADFAKVPYGTRTDMARQLITAVGAANLCPGLRLFIPKFPKRSQLDPHNLPADWEDDLALDADLVPALAVRVAPEARNESKKPRDRDVVEYYKFETSILGIDIHTSSHADPWTSPQNAIQARHKSAFEDTLLTHARAHFARQQRTHLFHLALTGRTARLFRLDRGCCALSHAFDYVAAPALLAAFLGRLAHLSAAGRGHDPSARSASRAEARRLDAHVHAFLARMQAGARPLARAETALDRDARMFPAWRIAVPDAARPAAPPTVLVVRRPFAGDTFFCGRGTRAYVAYDTARARLVFLKDQWRKGDGARLAECDALARLARAGVAHVPVLCGGGDVFAEDGEVQRTVVGTLAEFGEAAVPLVHHRVVQELLYPLSSARGAKEFLQALHDVVCAICDAHEGDAKLLHRDISYHNIMLTEEGRGVLVDWDWAGEIDNPDGGSGIGSWNYLSIGILEDSTKVNDVTDDLQSVFWVLVWAALTQFNAGPPAAVAEAMMMYAANAPEDAAEDEQDHRNTVADRKRGFLKGEFGAGLRTGSRAMDGLIATLAGVWAEFERSRNRDLEDTPPMEFLPSFEEWKEIFAKPLGRRRAAPPKAQGAAPRRSARLHTSPPDAPPAPPPPKQRKRKREDDSPADDTGTLRRSKRIKNAPQP